MAENITSNLSVTSDIVAQSFSVISDSFINADTEHSFSQRLPISSSSPFNIGQDESSCPPVEKKARFSTSLFPQNSTQEESTSELLFKQQTEVCVF